MVASKARVHVVDDDRAVRESAALLLQMKGHPVRRHCSGSEFLDQLDQLEPGCVLLDINMPGESGLDVLAAMERRGCDLPVVVMTGQGDVGMAVRAMKAGAIDFIEKPYSNELLLSSVERAAASLQSLGAKREKVEDARARIARLSSGELGVLRGLLAELPNRMVADALGLDLRTVELERVSLMDKLDARGLSTAVRLGLLAGVEPLVPAEAGH